MKMKKTLEYFRKSIFSEIYFKWIYWKIILFFLLPFVLLDLEPKSLFTPLIIWLLVMFIYFLSDKDNNKWYNFIRSLFIFWWLGLFFIHIDFNNFSFHQPIVWMVITTIFFLIIIPFSSYFLKRFNKLKFLPYSIFFYLFLWLLISEFLWI